MTAQRTFQPLTGRKDRCDVPGFHDQDEVLIMEYKASNNIVAVIAEFLMTGPILDHFEFPRLHYPNIPGYKPEYYRKMGLLIKEGTVPVYVDEDAPKNAAAYYQQKGNRLYLAKETAKLGTAERWSTVVHETTHIIQDWKKWKLSLAEIEADAHFAQALFMHYKGAAFGGDFLTVYAAAAKAYASGDKKEYKKLIGEMYLRVNEKYKDKDGYENMQKKTRTDGI
jgi:hypothetical protein